MAAKARRSFLMGFVMLASILAFSVGGRANPLTTIGSKTKTMVVAVGHGAKKVAMMPVKGVEHVKNAF